MKLYKFIVVIIALLALAATATYIVFSSDMFMDGNQEINSNAVNEIREIVSK